MIVELNHHHFIFAVVVVILLSANYISTPINKNFFPCSSSGATDAEFEISRKMWHINDAGLVLSPGLTNESIAIVHVDIDMSLPENQHPKPQNENHEGEFIKPLRVKKRELLSFLEMEAQQGVKVFASLYVMALGYRGLI